MPIERTRDFFDGYAGDFDAIYSSRKGLLRGVLNSVLRRSMKLRFFKTLEGCEPVAGKRVLDVGCGPGHYAITLAGRGAAEVVGLDFADGMIDLADRHAREAGVADRCRFLTADFFTWQPEAPFDYVILMGFMDYMEDPRAVVARALEFTKRRAFFSFPAAGGFLAWQRQLRYRNRCALFLYRPEEIAALFPRDPGLDVRIEKIARDYFVTAERREK
jgi:2-polyprenyl-3-methyl-5-hydroxy-6-metoxy-1,4-benzoquinol methylase